MTLKKPPQSPSALALYRYAVLSKLRLALAKGSPLATAVREVADAEHLGADGQPTRVGLRSIYRWRRRYDAQGLAGLEDKTRTLKSSDGVLEPALVGFLCKEKLNDPRASVPELIRRAVVAGLLLKTTDVDRTTVWRALRRRQVNTRRRRNDRKQRRFQKSSRLQMVLCDGKHFRAGPTSVKRVVLFFLDDATRFIPTAVVGPSESTALFLRGLYQLLRAVGQIDGIYVDHGSGFTSHNTRAVIANLGIAHILGKVAYPQARGKIERFNRTVQEDVIRHLCERTVDPDCAALELRFEHYLRHEYGPRLHAGLTNNLSPQAAFAMDKRPLRPYAELDILRRHFFVSVTRTVSNDHIISLDGVHLEVPIGLARQTVTLKIDALDASVVLLEHDGRMIQLKPVDLVANADAKRGTRSSPQAPNSASSGGAATRAFDAALSPITQPDGGFSAIHDEESS